MSMYSHVSHVLVVYCQTLMHCHRCTTVLYFQMSLYSHSFTVWYLFQTSKYSHPCVIFPGVDVFPPLCYISRHWCIPASLLYLQTLVYCCPSVIFPDHPAGTSKNSDICDLSKISDMKICIVGNGNIHIFKHPAYLSKDLLKIYI